MWESQTRRGLLEAGVASLLLAVSAAPFSLAGKRRKNRPESLPSTQQSKGSGQSARRPVTFCQTFRSLRDATMIALAMERAGMAARVASGEWSGGHEVQLRWKSEIGIDETVKVSEVLGEIFDQFMTLHLDEFFFDELSSVRRFLASASGTGLLLPHGIDAEELAMRDPQSGSPIGLRAWQYRRGSNAWSWIPTLAIGDQGGVGASN